MANKLKNVEVVIEDYTGVCLWRMPDGAFLGDDDGHFLSAEGRLDDVVIEERMRQAAVHYMGPEANMGEAVWLSGSRKVSDSEAEGQMERMLQGKIPDEMDEAKQAYRRR